MEGMEQVCFVPLPDRDLGCLATPVNGKCDISWHVHLWRSVSYNSRDAGAPSVPTTEAGQ